nr:retrotransposon protein, putative, Ty3-gypsy subclass [Tanacetum cinerariifolium]
MYKDAALAKELRDLSLCSAIPIPGYYKNNIKKYGIRKSRTYKGKLYNSHVKPFKRKSKQGNIASLAVYQELDLDDNWDIVSADFDDSSIYSISERECDVHQNISITIQDTLFEEAAFMTIEEINESDDEQNIEEDYDSHQAFMDQAKEYYKGKIVMQDKEELCQTKRSLLVSDLTNALKIIDQLKAEQMRLEVKKNEEIKMLKAQLQEKKDKEIEVQFSKEEFPPLENSQIARPFMEAEAHYSRNSTTTPKIKKITNQLYNVKVEFEIPSCLMFGTTAIIDTGASAYCINKKVIPEEALEPLTQIIFYNGLNSRQHATHKIKQGSFLIEGNKFKIPLIYAFDMRDNNGIEMLIGANFLRFMKGGIRIEGDEITIYKKVTRIKTSNQTKIAEIAKLEVNEEEFLEINESIYFKQEGSKTFLEQFKPVIDSLLEIGDIRPSKSRHRTMGMIENSRTAIDPITGREIKGKERMVFNYKSLNNNTYKDQYSLPGINMIIKRVGGAKVFSKFDLKSGFHQVAMDEESIPWTAMHMRNEGISSSSSLSGEVLQKGFLEDDDSSDDSFSIVDPGWDDYCLQKLKMNRLVPLCPDARRARM